MEIPELIAFDVETTGLKPLEGDRIIELALIRIRDGSVVEKIVTAVNPGINIPPEVCSIHGITDDMVKDAPPFRDIAGKIADFIRGKTLLIHNADFDISFLKKEFELCGMSCPEVKVIDTLAIAKNSFRFPGNSLSRIAVHYKIDTEGLHRAEADAMTTYMIYRRFCEELSRKERN
ncbi:MAG: 3'-5' exonuclease [Candidatus Omnitrophica bacterium]|nr:3'-5' exonuclease [Candidatus Omnitrophota bacterium]